MLVGCIHAGYLLLDARERYLCSCSMPEVRDAKVQDVSCEQCRCDLKFTCNCQNNMHSDKLWLFMH